MRKQFESRVFEGCAQSQLAYVIHQGLDLRNCFSLHPSCHGACWFDVLATGELNHAPIIQAPT